MLHMQNKTKLLVQIHKKMFRLPSSSSTGIAQFIQPRAMGWTVEIQFPEGQDIFLFSNYIASVADSSSYPMGTGGLFLRR
jgi:hypothetical protein